MFRKIIYISLLTINLYPQEELSLLITNFSSLDHYRKGKIKQTKKVTFAQQFHWQDFNYKAAGVLPYTIVKGKRYALLLSNDHNIYDAFFGERTAGLGKQPKIEKYPKYTAAKQLATKTKEKLIPKVGKNYLSAIRNYIDVDNDNTEAVIANGDTQTAHYITIVDTNLVRAFIKSFFLPQMTEKNNLALVEWDDFENTIAKNLNNVKATVFDGKKAIHNQDIELQSILVLALSPYFQKKNYVEGVNKKIHFYPSL